MKKKNNICIYVRSIVGSVSVSVSLLAGAPLSFLSFFYDYNLLLFVIILFCSFFYRELRHFTPYFSRCYSTVQK